jgi:hypothetical protein
MPNNKFVLVPVEKLMDWRNDLSNYSIADTEMAREMDKLIAAAPQAALMTDEREELDRLRSALALSPEDEASFPDGFDVAVLPADRYWKLREVEERAALSAAPVSEQAQEASTAQPDSERETQYVAELRKELQGWKQEAKERQHENELLRERMQLRTQEQRRDVWFWQGDGEDHLESMSNGMAVVIRADRLRALAAPQDAQERDATKLRHPLCGGAGNVGKEPEL